MYESTVRRSGGYVSRRRPLTALAGVSALVLSGCATAKLPVLTEQERRLNLASFEQVWTTIDEQYWDPNFRGLDWQAVGDELRPRIEQASTMADARTVLRDLISRLKLSHFAIIPAEVYKELGQAAGDDAPTGETGIGVRVIDGHALVTSVAENSTADRIGVRTGWEIVRVGETDVVARLRRLDRELPDTPSKRVRLVAGMVDRLDPSIGKTVSVTFLDGGNNAVELDIPYGEPRGQTGRLGNLGDIRVWIEVKRIGGTVGHIAFNGFFNPPYLMKEFNDAMRSFMDGDGVIIDLRGNSGGMGAMAMGMAGWLIDEDRSFGTLRTRDNELSMIVQSRATTYAGPVAVLVDGLSGSASEFFAGGLQDFGRACIVGSRTKGEALPGQFRTLPNGDVFLYATANFVMAGGSELEGVSVMPDIEVHQTREALLQGRDLVLEAAVAWIRDQE